MKYKIPFIKPMFPSASEISEDFSKIVEANWYTNFGPYERNFRNEISDYVGKGVHVVTVANATLGIELAVSALLSKKGAEGKEVLIQSFTFAAGPEVLVRCGFTPVFIDVKKDTWQPDIDQARSYIKNNTGKIAGILLCNTFGVGNPDIARWEALALEHKFPLIIDTAAGFGSRYSSRENVGRRGDCEIFSLHATKPFCVGEGGLVVTRNAELAKTLRNYENFGFDENHEISVIGTNAKLQELNCAIGLRQLKLLDHRLLSRQENLARLKKSLGEDFSFQANDDMSSIPFASVLINDAKLRDASINNLNEKGVEVKTYYAPLHKQAVLMAYCKLAGELTVTEDIASRIISLPLYETMTHGELKLITDVLITTNSKQLT